MSGGLSDRTRLIFSRVLELDPDDLSREIQNQTLLVTLNPDWAATYSGQVLAFTFLNVVLRWDLFLPRTEMLIPEVELKLKNPLLKGDDLRSALQGLAEDLGQANRAGFLSHLPPLKVPDHVVNLGATPQRGGRQTLDVACEGWIAHVSRTPLEVPPPVQHLHNPIGACAAAVLGAAQLFNGLLEPYLRRRPDFALPTRITFNTFTYSIERELNPKLPSSKDLGKIVLLGAGGLGSALLFILTLAEDLRGALTIIDPDYVEVHSLNRMLTSTLSEVGQQGQGLNKAVLAADYVRKTSQLQIDAWPCSYQEARQSKVLTQVWAWEEGKPLPILTVDRAEARLALQEDLSQGEFSEALIGGYARLDCLVAKAYRSGPCISCLERAGLLGTAPSETPSISHVTAFAGVLLSAELLKRILRGGRQPLNERRNLFLTSLSLPPSPSGLLRLNPIPSCVCQRWPRTQLP